MAGENTAFRVRTFGENERDFVTQSHDMAEEEEESEDAEVTVVGW